MNIQYSHCFYNVYVNKFKTIASEWLLEKVYYKPSIELNGERIQYGYGSYSSYKTVSISRQQDILLRHMTGDNSCRWFLWARSITSSEAFRALSQTRVGPLYPLSPPLLSDGKKVKTIRPTLRAAVTTDPGQTKVNLFVSEFSSQWKSLTSPASCAASIMFIDWELSSNWKEREWTLSISLPLYE